MVFKRLYDAALCQDILLQSALNSSAAIDTNNKIICKVKIES